MLTLGSDWTGKRVLDVGCGLGHLLEYVREQGIEIASYTGLDLSPEMIKECKSHFEGRSDVGFLEGDFMTYPFVLRYDVVAASGLLSHRIENDAHPLKTIQEKMAMLYDLCEDVAAMNFLSTYTSHAEKDEITFQYFHPLDILKIALDITPYVELKQSYLPNDFTVLLFKR